MTTRQLLLTVVIGAIGEVALLAAFVFLAEPQDVGGPARAFHLVDLAYFLVPTMLLAAAAAIPVRALLRARHRRPA